jgi:hypothetical protein
MRRILRNDAHDLAVQVVFQRTEVRAVVARSLEIEADGKRGSARSLRPTHREAEEHRGVDASTRHDSHAANADQRDIDRANQRPAKKLRRFGEARGSFAWRLDGLEQVLALDAKVETTPRHRLRNPGDQGRESGGIKRIFRGQQAGE